MPVCPHRLFIVRGGLCGAYVDMNGLHVLDLQKLCTLDVQAQPEHLVCQTFRLHNLVASFGSGLRGSSGARASCFPLEGASYFAIAFK